MIYRFICLICYYQFRMCSGMGAVANLRIIERQSEVKGFHRSILHKISGFIGWIIQMQIGNCLLSAIKTVNQAIARFAPSIVSKMQSWDNTN